MLGIGHGGHLEGGGVGVLAAAAGVANYSTEMVKKGGKGVSNYLAVGADEMLAIWPFQTVIRYAMIK